MKRSPQRSLNKKGVKGQYGLSSLGQKTVSSTIK